MQLNTNIFNESLFNGDANGSFVGDVLLFRQEVRDLSTITDGVVIRQIVSVGATTPIDAVILRQQVELRHIFSDGDALILRQNVRHLIEYQDQLIIRQEVE